MSCEFLIGTLLVALALAVYVGLHLLKQVKQACRPYPILSEWDLHPSVSAGEERFRPDSPNVVGKWRELKYLFAGAYCFIKLEGEDFGAVKPAVPYPSGRLALHFEFASVRRIELRSIPGPEFGPEVCDQEGYLKELRRKKNPIDKK